MYGDFGNRMDIADAEHDIAQLRARRERDAHGVGEQGRIILALREELGRQKLAITALTRFMLAKGLATESELDDFIREIDAEDGELDGKIPIEENGRLKFRPGDQPGGGK